MPAAPSPVTVLVYRPRDADRFAELVEVPAKRVDVRVATRAEEAAALLGMEAFFERTVNGALSGGEKKRSEILQLVAMAPKAAILDEVDSGLDIDAVREVAEAVQQMRGPGIGVLLITHYARILRYLEVDRVYVMIGGRVVESGGRDLAERVDQMGYEGLRAELGLEEEAEGAEDDFLKGL